MCEVTIQDKKWYVAVISRSPSQESIEFESFLSGFEDMLSVLQFSKSQLRVSLGYFSCRPLLLWPSDIAYPNCTLTGSLMTTYGFE